LSKQGRVRGAAGSHGPNKVGNYCSKCCHFSASLYLHRRKCSRRTCILAYCKRL